MRYGKFVTLFLILLAGCFNRNTGWVPLRTDKDYDIVRYDLSRRIVWATNNFEDHVVAVTVDVNGAPVRDMSVIDLPMDDESLGLCVTDSVWVVTGDTVLRYIPDGEEWDTEFQLDFDYVNSCKTLQDGSVVFLGNKNHTELLAQYRTVGSVSYMQLLPDWRDVTQDDEGNLWLATESGIYTHKSQNRSWELWSNQMGADAIYFTGKTLWVINDQSIYYWVLVDGANPKKLNGVDFNSPPAVYQGTNGQIWIVSQKGIWEFLNGSVELVTIPKWVDHINIKNDFDPGKNLLFLSTENGPYSVKLGK